MGSVHNHAEWSMIHIITVPAGFGERSCCRLNRQNEHPDWKHISLRDCAALFSKERIEEIASRRVSTGFPELDRSLGGGLANGLYVLGAVPGLGKSTLALQIACHLSGQGIPVLYFALEMYFYWWVGTALERAWGEFRFTVYWLAGMIGAILTCLITGYGATSGLFLSLFFAYAWMWPDQQILLFFFIPVKVKWIGWIAGAFWLYELATALLRLDLVSALSLVFGLAGFLLFFGGEIFRWCKDSIVSYRRRRDWQNKWK